MVLYVLQSTDDFSRSLSELGFIDAASAGATTLGSMGSLRRSRNSSDINPEERDVVFALFRRLHGLDDFSDGRDGEAADSDSDWGRGSDRDSRGGDTVAERPVTYSEFVRWSAPLSGKLYVAVGDYFYNGLKKRDLVCGSQC